MSKGRVLVIDDDEWVCRLLSVAMREAGFEVTMSETAADGFFKAVDEQPDCIVCDVDLPDQKGYWVAQRIRAHPSRVSIAPFVFLSGMDDREHRLEGFQVGGDAFITKPFRIDEVVAQVDALIQMASRLRRARHTLTSIPPGGSAMIGDLAQMSVATVLTLLDLERRSGSLELSRKAGSGAAFFVASGAIVKATLAGQIVEPLSIVRTVMSWTEGKFAFSPGEAATDGIGDPTPINALLMEAARLEDEERADGDRPSSARLASWRELARSSAAPGPDVLAPIGSWGPSVPPPEEPPPSSLRLEDLAPSPTFGEPPIPAPPPSALRPLIPPRALLTTPKTPGVAPAPIKPSPAPKPRLPPPTAKTGFGAPMRTISTAHAKAIAPEPPASIPPQSLRSEDIVESGWSAPPPPPDSGDARPKTEPSDTGDESDAANTKE